jgi:hypothetical protein
MCYWTGSEVRESAIGIGSMIRTLLEELWLWLDLLGAGRVELSMALDLGVFGEDCVAMEVILDEDLVDRGWVGEWVLECQWR